MSTRREDGIFRDFLPGMEGRRDDLLRRRRAELATMPHALRRIYVARIGRVAAAATACAGGAVLVGAAVDPGYQGLLAGLLPGKEPAVLSTLLLGTLVLSALSYLLGRCIAEARFTRAMARCVLPDVDVASDVERLSHVRPDRVASAMIQGFESPAAVLPPAAIGMIAPCALAYLVMAFGAGGYPKEAIVDATFTAYGTTLATTCCAGLAAALFLGLSRKRHEVGHATRAAGALATAVTAAGVVWASASGYAWAGLVMVVLALLASVALVQRERRIVLLDEIGELWTVRSLVASVWSLARRACAHLTIDNLRRVPSWTLAALRRPRIRRIAVVGVAAAGAVTYLLVPAAPAKSAAARQAASPATSVAVAPSRKADVTRPRPDQPTASLTHSGITGIMSVHVDGDTTVALIGAHGEAQSIPPGWSGRVTVSLSGDAVNVQPLLLVGGVPVDEGAGEKSWTRIDPELSERPLEVQLVADGEHSVYLRYELVLTPPVSED